MVAPPRNQENQADAGADGAVGNVKGGKADFGAASLLEVKVNEINHMPHPQPVDEVPHDSAEDQAESNLAEEGARVKMVPAKEQDEQRDESDAGQQLIVAAEQAPGRAGIPPVHELEEPPDHD